MKWDRAILKQIQILTQNLEDQYILIELPLVWVLGGFLSFPFLQGTYLCTRG